MRFQALFTSVLLVGCSTGGLRPEAPDVDPAPRGQEDGSTVRAQAVVTEKAPHVLDGPKGIYVTSAKPERPRVRYHDGQLSRNDTCFVRLGNKLNDKVPPLYINGAPVGFC